MQDTISSHLIRAPFSLEARANSTMATPAGPWLPTGTLSELPVTVPTPSVSSRHQIYCLPILRTIPRHPDT